MCKCDAILAEYVENIKNHTNVAKINKLGIIKYKRLSLKKINISMFNINANNKI